MQELMKKSLEFAIALEDLFQRSTQGDIIDIGAGEFHDLIQEHFLLDLEPYQCVMAAGLLAEHVNVPRKSQRIFDMAHDAYHLVNTASHTERQH